jgi:hypothetical protein
MFKKGIVTNLEDQTLDTESSLENLNSLTLKDDEDSYPI